MDPIELEFRLGLFFLYGSSIAGGLLLGGILGALLHLHQWGGRIGPRLPLFAFFVAAFGMFVVLYSRLGPAGTWHALRAVVLFPAAALLLVVALLTDRSGRGRG